MFDAIIDFRNKLQAGRVLLGSGIYMTDPQSSEALADSVDFLWYDLEHQAMSVEALRNHLMVARHKNKPGIVRVPGPGAATLKPILDIGAHGIVVPNVRTVEEVQQIVDDCRFPPQGQRGFWPMIPTNYCRDDMATYLAQSDKHLFVSVMIETIEAVESIDEIVAIEGLDSVVMGLMDLSGAFGVLGQADHPDVVASTDKVITSARKAGMPVGCGQGTNVETICALARRGIQWFQSGADCLYMVEFMEQFADRIKKNLEA